MFLKEEKIATKWYIICMKSRWKVLRRRKFRFTNLIPAKSLMLNLIS